MILLLFVYFQRRTCQTLPTGVDKQMDIAQNTYKNISTKHRIEEIFDFTL